MRCFTMATLRRSHVGADSNPVTPRRPMQIPLKMDLAILPDPEGLAFQFSTRVSLPARAQWTMAVTTSTRIVKHCVRTNNTENSRLTLSGEHLRGRHKCQASHYCFHERRTVAIQ